MIENLTSLQQEDILQLIAGLKKQIRVIEALLLKIQKSLYGAPTWIAPSYLNSWINYGSSYQDGGYTKTDQGIVLLRGMIKSGTTNTASFTLPAGYRPASKRVFVVASNSAMGAVEVRTNGDVVVTIGNNTYVSLEGVSFYAEA